MALQPKKAVLSDVMLETLSIIAYKQPVTKMEIEKIRGVKSDHAVNRLVEYNLVYEVGRLDAPGRPALLPPQRNFCAGSAWDRSRICRIWVLSRKRRSRRRWRRSCCVPMEKKSVFIPPIMSGSAGFSTMYIWAA